MDTAVGVPVTMDDGARLRTFTSGPAGAPPLMLLHGGPGLWDYLGPLAALFDHSFRVHRYDQRGCGRSTGPGDYRIARFVADLDRLRAWWGYQRWTVFGHSWGATLALAYAAAYTDRVSALVYCSGVGPGTDWKRAYNAEVERRLSEAEWARRNELAALARAPDQEIEFRVLSWSPDHGDRARARRWASEDARAPFPINTAAHRRLSAEQDRLDVQTLGRTVTAPTLIIHGQLDPRPAHNAQRLGGAIPQARCEIVAGAGHYPWREAPERLSSLVGSFLTEQR